MGFQVSGCRVQVEEEEFSSFRSQVEEPETSDLKLET
jgi:hypothetical protein